MIDGYVNKAPEVVNSLRTIRNLTIEIRDKLMNGNLNDFGELLLEEYKNRKRLAPVVVTPMIEQLFEIALNNGASGGKICGAGGGGCVLFYCENNSEGRVKQKLENAGAKVIDFNFDFTGLKTWA